MRRIGILGGVSLAFLLVVSGCSSSKSSSSAPGTASGGTAVSGKPAPPAFTVGYVDVAATIGVEPQIYSGFAGAAKALGWKVMMSDAQLSSSKALQATELFVSQHVDAIVFSSVPGQWVAAGLNQAKAAKIPTVNLISPYPGFYDAQYVWKATPQSEQGLVDVMKKQLKPGASIGDMYQSGVEEYSNEHESLLADFKAAGFRVAQSINVPSSPETATLYTKGAASMMASHPEITGLVDELGHLSAILPGLQSAHATGVSVYSQAATSVTVPFLMASGSQVKALIVPPEPQIAAQAVDNLLTYAVTKKLPGDTSISDPTTVYTADTIPDFLKKTPDSNEFPVKTADILAPLIQKWSKTYTLPKTK